MLVHRRVTPSIKFAATRVHTWLERGTVRVKCLAQEHNAMAPAKAKTRTARSGDERTNHEATAPPTNPGIKLVSNGQVNLITHKNEYAWFKFVPKYFNVRNRFLFSSLYFGIKRNH